MVRSSLNVQTIETNDISKEMDKRKEIEKRVDEKWEVYKKQSKLIVRAFAGQGYFKRASKIRDCGKNLVFALNIQHERKLKSAMFCKDVMCPVCNWRRSIKRKMELEKHINVLQYKGFTHTHADKTHTHIVKDFSHVTFTLKSTFDIEGTVNRLWQSWRKLQRRAWYKKMFLGAYCSIEYTYNDSNGYHPHLHCLLAWNDEWVSKFKCGGKFPVKLKCWQDLTNFLIKDEWEKITGDSRVVNVKNKTKKSLHEVTKYITNFKNLFNGADGGERVIEMAKELKGRRKYQVSGCFRNMDINEDDLIHIDEEKFAYEDIVGYEEWIWDDKLNHYHKYFFTKEEYQFYKEEKGKHERALLCKKCV